MPLQYFNFSVITNPPNNIDLKAVTSDSINVTWETPQNFDQLYLERRNIQYKLQYMLAKVADVKQVDSWNTVSTFYAICS